MLPTLLARSARGAFLALAALSVLATAGAAQAGGTAREVEPPLAVFLDSAALVRAVAALPGPDLLPRGVPPLFWITFDSATAALAVRAVFEQIPASYTEPVAAAIRAHLKPQKPTKRPIYTHLRVVTGPEPLVDRPALRERLAAVANSEEVSRLLRRVIKRFYKERRLQGVVAYTVHLRLRVHTDGTTDSAEIVRSTGEPDLDRRVLEMAGQIRFTPAMLEDVPVRVWVTVPLTLAMQ